MSEHPEIEPAAEAPSSASLREAPSPTRGEGDPGLPEPTPESLAPIAPLSPGGRGAGGEGAEASLRAEVEDDKAEAPPGAAVEDKAQSAPIAPLSPRGRGAGGEGAAPPAVVTRSDKTHRLRERRNRGFAKAMRRNPTEAEQKLWLILKDRRFSGFKFRRQVPIGPFIADFVCYSRRLIVELDGSQHADNAADEHRAATLAEKGFATIRVWNSDLTTNPDGVAAAIWHKLEERAHG